MTSGFDNIQFKATFGALQDSCEELKKELELVEKDIEFLQSLT